jgi:HAD superfamily hydrolase (TIGR01509 family)
MPSTPDLAGVLFDFNGVLLLDAHLHEQAWHEMALQLRGRELSPHELRHFVHGRTNLDILSHLLGRTPSTAELDELASRKEATYQQRCLAAGDQFRLAPGAIPLLDNLCAAGIRRAIATSSPRTNVDFFIAHLGLERWFAREAIIYDDGSFPGKPSPDIYRIAAARLGLSPAACVVIEDAISGIEAARRAGCGRIIAIGGALASTDGAIVPADGGASTAISLAIDRLDQFPISWFDAMAVGPGLRISAYDRV